MKRILTHSLIVFVAFLMAACATVVKPDGGPRDLSPPEILDVQPPSGTTQFNAEKIEIEFDEFVVLEKLREQLVVSPPMSEKPRVSIRGKKVVIELPDSLRPNTTYSLFFGNAVVNYKEKIPATGLEYVFSTGPKLDSMFIRGNVVNAIDDSPAKGVLVMLYKDVSDTAIYYEKPYYLAKTTESGSFRLSSLAPGSYRIFALEDLNNNYIYDQGDEKMAFVNHLVKAYHTRAVVDSLDMLKAEQELPKPLRLNLFQPLAETQFIEAYSTSFENQADLVFRRPARRIGIEPLDFEKTKHWDIRRFSLYRDSLHLWFRNLPLDTFRIVVSENDKVLDTLELKFESKEKKALQLRTNASDGVGFFEPLILSSSVPLKHIPQKRITLTEKDGDEEVPVAFELKEIKRTNRTRFALYYEGKESVQYTLTIPAGVIKDIYDNTNDTLIRNYKTANERKYGSLNLQMAYKGKHPLYIELLNGKQVVEGFSVKGDTLIRFPYLDAGKYTLRAVVDRNNNKRWDTGNLDRKHQPERVLHLGRDIGIRSNWDVEHKWEIKL